MEKIWIVSLLGSLAWALAVLLAFVGYGDRILRVFRQRSGWIPSFLCGFAAVVMVGGFLNFAHWIRPGVLLAIVLVGASLAVLRIVREGLPKLEFLTVSDRQHMWLVGLFVCCVLLVAFRIIATVHRVNYHPVDDLNEYLSFPKKMLQEHFFAPDPFSERRLINSVGPTYFVQDLILAALPLTHLQMADETVGMLLLVACLIVLARRWKTPTWAMYLGVFLSFIAIQSTFNLSFTVLPGALLLAMVLFASDETLGWSSAKVGLLLGATVGVVTGLKTTYLPHAVLLAVLLCALRGEKINVAETVRGWFAALAGFVLVLGAWMVAMRRTSGTFLFPLFGQGVHYEQYYKLEKLHWKMHSVYDVLQLLWLLPLLALLLWVIRRVADGRVRMALAMLGATSLAALAAAVATAGDAVMRYNMPCVFPAMVITFLALTSVKVEGRTSILRVGATYTVLLLLALTYSMDTSIVQAEEMPLKQAGVLRRDFAAAFHSGALPMASMKTHYEAMEDAIAPGETTLSILQTPYYLDFSKREIYTAGLTGAASPKPGWPIFGSGEEFATYLRGQHIRYLAYTYDDGGLSKREIFQLLLKSAWTTTIVKNEVILEQQAWRQFDELAATRKHVYDDGHMYLLDLEQSR